MASAAAASVKSPEAFRTISEVAEMLDVPQHVLRFWESKFAQIRPMKRGGGRRYYRPEDVLLLRRIRQCLYDDGYTIKGVQRLLREGALKGVEAAEMEISEPEPPEPHPALGRGSTKTVLRELRRELVELRDILRKAQS